MIPFFAGYALLVWWPCLVHRRRWPSFLAAIVGALGLLGLIRLHIQAGIWTNGAIYVPVFQSLLIPYTFLVTIVGLYIAILPRTAPLGYCGTCGYDLQGLAANDVTLCPECGVRFRPENSPPHKSPHKPKKQHPQRHPADQPQRDRSTLPVAQLPDPGHGPRTGPLGDQLILPAQPEQA